MRASHRSRARRYGKRLHDLRETHALPPFPAPVLMSEAGKSITSINEHWPGQCSNPNPHAPHQRTEDEACPGAPRSEGGAP